MSQENVELVQRGWEHFLATGEPEWDTVDEEVEAYDHDIFDGRDSRGHVGIRRWLFEDWGSAWSEWSAEPQEFIDAGDRVVAGKRKKLKTDASEARVPLSATMASWLAKLRPEDARADALVFPSAVGTPLNYHNVYSRVLRPALERSGIATVVGHKTVRRHDKDIEVPIYDYDGVAFHAFRKAAGSLLLANGKTLKQVQGWLRHSQLTTTMNVYITQVDDGLGSADVWDDILPVGGPATTGGPEGGPEGGFGAPEGVAEELETPKTSAVS
jgi:hypothetical protein